MANNIFQERITPEKPKVLAQERVYVYVPKASNTDAGIASFKDTDFTVNSGEVTIKQSIKDQITQNTEDIEDLQDRMDNVEDGLEDLTPRVEALENTVTGFDSRITTAEQNASEALETAEDALSKAEKAVRYDSQTLTPSEKTQARTNINAASTSDLAKKVDKDFTGTGSNDVTGNIQNDNFATKLKRRTLSPVTGKYNESFVNVCSDEVVISSKDTSNDKVELSVLGSKINISQKDGADTASVDITAEYVLTPDEDIDTNLFINDHKVILDYDLVQYYRKAQTYNKTEVDALIATIPNIKYELVNVLPTADATTWFNASKTIYLVPSASQTTSNVKDEFITIRTETQESITASEDDDMEILGTITINTATLKSKLQPGTHIFEKIGYPKKIKYSSMSIPMTILNLTRDTVFDNNVLHRYSWVDENNNFYITNTLRPTATTRLYNYDISLGTEGTDTGYTFMAIVERDLINGYWTLGTANGTIDATPLEYGLQMASSGFPGSKIKVVYVANAFAYSWEQIGTTAVDLSNYYTKAETKALYVSGDNYIIVDDGEEGTATAGKKVIELDATNIETSSATTGSSKLITSGAVASGLGTKQNAISIVEIQLVSAQTSSGTLTNEQLATLQASPENYINTILTIDNTEHIESYKLNTDASDDGILQYVHSMYENNVGSTKYLTITTSTGSWVITNFENASKNYVDTLVGNIDTLLTALDSGSGV